MKARPAPIGRICPRGHKTFKGRHGKNVCKTCVLIKKHSRDVHFMKRQMEAYA